MIHPYEVREVIGTGGMAERKSAYPHQTEGLTMDVRILFLTAQPPLPLAPFVHWWKRNWDRYSQPLAAHRWATKGCPYRRSRRRMSVCVCPSKSDRHIRTHFSCGASVYSRFQSVPSVCFSFCWKRNWDRYSQPLAAHEWATKGCPYRRSRRRMSVCVCPNKSDRHIRTHFLFGLRLVHAFKRVSELEGVFLISCCFRILEMFHSICLLLRLPPFCDFQTAHQVVILVRLQR